MRHLTLSEDDVRQLKAGDPLDYYANRKWVPVTVVEVRDRKDTVLVAGTDGDWQAEAEWGELRG